MITTADKDYKETKRIKQGKMRLAAPFDELSQWIGSKWDVSVLNVRYDRANSLHAPRLQVVFEYEKHAQQFYKGINFDERKQDAIERQFLEIIGRDSKHHFDVDGLFVIFSSFEPVAKEEADSKIKNDEIESLKITINNPELWEISRCFGHVTFFFYTDEQVKRYESEGKRDEYAMMYFELLKPHDEFNYLRYKDFRVDFDSKQNFDDNSRSSWFYYYR